MSKSRIIIPREVLLVEIERRCSAPECNAKNRVGLTKEEARVYLGFECERCEVWNADVLEERDVPEWWEELTITGLDGVRVRESREEDEAETSEVVERLSEAYRRAEGGRQ